MRILVIEDDSRIADFVVRALHSEGHTCVHAGNGSEGLSLGKDADFDLIVLDLMLPEVSGLEICQELRMREVFTPIIMLTALNGADDIIAGLRMGADDYMTKPFAIDELLARIEAVSRRGRLQKDNGDDKLCIGDVELDRRSMQVVVAGEYVSLTAKELAVLELLMAQPGRLFSRERILSNVWGMNIDPLTNVVDVYIGKIRKKIALSDGAPFIETVRGMGYRINAPH